MLRDVRTVVSDGGLGLSGTKGQGVHLKIGVSPIQSDLITITGNMNHKIIKERLGLSPLADACMDSIENGSNKIYCLPVAASISGTVGELEMQVTGGGSCTVEGSPNNSFEIIVKFTGSGGFNQAACVYSLDGGYSYSSEETLSLTGELSILQTGLVFKFTEGVQAAESFLIGDIYRIKTEAPIMSNQDVLSAIDMLKYMTTEFEYVHIVGESTKELWHAVSVEQKKLLQYHHKPLFFIMEARKPSENEVVADYAIQLSNDSKDIANYDIQVVAARSIYTRMDNVSKEINNAGIVCGLYSRARVQQSIGETKSFSIDENKMLGLMPKGIEEYTGLLDEAKYLTFRKYDGLQGFYVTNARMMCPENSDYRYAEDSRVKNKILRETRKEALLQLHSEVDMSDVQGSQKAIAQFISTPLDRMVENKEIAKARISIPEGQDILVTETLNAVVRYVPVGRIREIVLDIGMENPYREG